MSTDSEVSVHYSSGDLLARLNAALSDDGVEPAHLSLQMLAPYDQFHGRGLEATIEMAGIMPIRAPITFLTLAAASVGRPATLPRTSAVASRGSI